MKIQTRHGRINLVIFFTYAFLVLTLLFSTGTFFSGYHLYDDQILINFNADLHTRPFFSAAWFQIKDDLFLRFRPLSILYYEVLAKCAYPSFSAIAMLVSLQAIFTCYFFYRFARYFKCSHMLAFFFPLFIVCGNQGVIFWRNGVLETPAMFLLSISFFFLGKLSASPSRLNVVMFSLFLALSTFAKESFIIFVPAVLFFKIWQDGVTLKENFWFSLKQNKLLVIFFTLLIAAELAIILYYKYHSNRFMEYVSVDKETFKAHHLFISTFRLWFTKGYLLAIVPAVIFILCLKNKLHRKKEMKQLLLFVATFFLLATIPQILLYSKSLIFERYLLPGTVAAAVVILFIQQYIDRHPTTLKVLNNTFLPACILILFVQIILMIKGAKVYAEEGYEVKNMLTTIIRQTEQNDVILIVARPQGQSEHALSVKTYLNAAIGGKRSNVFIEPVVDTTLRLSLVSRSDVDNFKQMTKGITYADIKDQKNIGCITFFPNIKDSFLLRHPEFDTTPYTQNNAGKFLILIKNKKPN